MKKKILTIFIILFALLIIIGIATSGNDNSKQSTQTLDSIVSKNLNAIPEIKDNELILTFTGISNLNDNSLDFSKIINEKISNIKTTLKDIKSFNNFKDYKSITVDIKGNLKYGKDNKFTNAILTEITFDVSNLKNIDLSTCTNKDLIQKSATSITINPELKSKLNTSTIDLLTIDN